MTTYIDVHHFPSRCVYRELTDCVHSKPKTYKDAAISASPWAAMHCLNTLLKFSLQLRGLLSSDMNRHNMTRLLTTVITPPEYVRVKKSSLTLGYASKFFNLFSIPSMVRVILCQPGPTWPHFDARLCKWQHAICNNAMQGVICSVA